MKEDVETTIFVGMACQSASVLFCGSHCSDHQYQCDRMGSFVLSSCWSRWHPFLWNCAQAKSINTWLQLAVNALSTILLCASNYCMGSPTREEVDDAHSKGLFLHFGVPSLHNIVGIGGKRKVLWLSLGLSALPLHLVCVVASRRH